MLDFAPSLTTAQQTPLQRVPVHQVTEPVPEVAQRVVVSQPAATSHLMRPDTEWGWSDLRDFVIGEIEKRHGPQVRDPRREASIFKSFMTRWPDQSVAIARAAFGPAIDGMWRSAPISVNRFCKASDPYFSAAIAERL